MNLKEFAALKAGDKINNGWTESDGEITEVTDKGVRVVWGEKHPHATYFFYSVVSTAWAQWTKVETGGPGVIRPE